MKFTKKLFVGLIALALLIPCLTFTSAAEFTEADIEDILEYYTCSDFVSVDYDDLATGKYTQHYDESGNDEYSFRFNRIDSDTTDRYTVVDSGDGKMLQIANTAPLGVHYEFNFAEGELSTLVTSIRYKTSAGEDEAGSTFSLFIYAHDADNDLYPNPRVRTLAFNCDADDPANNTVEYLTVVDGAYYEDTVLEGFTPALDTWYTIEAVYNLPLDTYTITITPDGGEAVTIESALGTLEYIDTARLEVRSSKNKTANYTWLDDLKVYEGTYVRDNAKKNDMTAEAILNLKSLAESTSSNTVPVRIANVLKAVVLDGGYTPNAATPDKAKVEEAILWAKDYVYPTYIEYIVKCASDINTEANYYDRNDYCIFLEAIDAVLPDDAAELSALPGVVSVNAEAVLAAKAEIRAERAAVDTVKAHSEAFIDAMLSYDASSIDFGYINGFYLETSAYTERDSEYNYVPKDKKEEIIFATVADAELAFADATAKRDRILDSVTAFIDGIETMAGATDFKTLYAGYLAAYGIYSDGIIDEELDNATYNGLLEAIAQYDSLVAVAEARIAPCDEFIDLVNRADIAMYHSTKKEYIASAYLYIDDNTAEYVVEPDYPGIAEAKAKFEEIRDVLTANLANANAYISAVDAIADATTFAAKKEAVAGALLLKELGDIIGIAGVAEANIALAKAESDITVAEGASETLISIIAELAEAESLAERMELINTANRFAPLAEDSIDGVTAARAALQNAIDEYNSDVKALNDAFAGALLTSVSIGA